MDAQITRLAHKCTAGIPLGTQTSSPIDVRAYRWGQVHVNTWGGGNTATFAAATALGGVYRPVKDVAGAVVQPAAGSSRVIQLPDSVMAGHFVRVVSAKTAGSITPLGVTLKG